MTCWLSWRSFSQSDCFCSSSARSECTWLGMWRVGQQWEPAKKEGRHWPNCWLFPFWLITFFLVGSSEEGRWMEGKTLQTPTHSPYRHGNSLVHWPEHAQRLGQTQIRVPNVWPHGFRQTLPNRMITPTAQMSEYQQSAPGDSDQGPTRAKYYFFRLMFIWEILQGWSQLMHARTRPASEWDMLK